jgi:hypothetical protein
VRAELTGGLYRPLHLGPRGAIGAHGIQSNDAWHGVACKTLAGFFDFHYFASFVVAALGAGAMGHLLFVAVRTLRERVLRQSVVSATGRSAFLGVSPFWIRHENFLFWVPPSKLYLAGVFSSGSFSTPDRLYREIFCLQLYFRGPCRELTVPAFRAIP